MKKLTILATAMIVATMALSAGNLGGKKFYINPGHGGHDSDDRPTALPLGVEMFYESDGTLSRGKHLATFIQDNGGAYKMSRTTNTSADDLPLSTIAAQSNSYGGYFMSLHSNAGTASANYMIAFFRSSSSAKNTPTISGAKPMTEAAVKWHDDTKLTSVTYATPRAIGDYSFYNYNLGVLRTNSRPGYLMESWFHDYRPEALRMKSSKYNKFLAWQLARALFDSPGATSGTIKGCVIGDIRDTSKGCGYSNYTTRGRDSYLAINGAKVTLTNSAGTQVASMTTDNCCNGVYAFFDLDPGTYTVQVSKTGYVTKTASVTVKNNQSTLKNFSVSEGADTGITLDATSQDFGKVEIGSSKTLSVKVTGSSLSSAITVTSNKSVFTVDNASLAKTGGTLKITFTPTAVGDVTGKITLASGSEKATISLTATGKNPTLALSAGKRYGSAYNATATVPGGWLPDNNWGLIRNMDYGNGKLYLVNASGGEIYVVNAQTFELVTKLQMPESVVNGGTYKVMDVKVKGSKIFACNLATDATQNTRVYQWDNDYAAPVCILDASKRGSVARLGDTFDFDGNLTVGRFLFAGKNTDTGNYKIITYAVTDGTVNATPVNHGIKADDGSYLDLGSSPRVVAETSGRFWVMGSALQPTLLSAEGVATKSINPESLGDVVSGNDFVRFSFKGDSYALATTYVKKGASVQTSSDGTKTTTTKNYQFGRVALLDVNDGWASASRVKYYPAYGVGSESNTYLSTSNCVKVHKDANGDAYAVEIWVLISKQGLQYFKYVDSGKKIPAPTIQTAPEANVTTDATDEDLDFGKVEVGKSVTRKVKVSGSKVYSDIKVSIGTGGTDQENFAVTPDKISYDETTLSASGTVTVTYAPKSVGKHYFNLRFDVTDAEGKSQKFSVRYNGEGIDDSSENPDPVDPDPEEPDDPVVNPGDDDEVKNDDIASLTQVWNYSTTAQTASQAPWLNVDVSSGSNYTRDIAVGGGKLYALNCAPYGKPEISVVNSADGTLIGKLDVTGVEGGVIPAAGIALLGRNIIVSNAARAGSDPLRIYVWRDDSDTPALLYEDAAHNGTRYGEHITAEGDMELGYLRFCDGYKVYTYTVENGQIKADAKVTVLSKDDAALAFHTLNTGTVHVAMTGENTMWLNGKDDQPYMFDLNGEYLTKLSANHTCGSVAGTSVTAFKFGKRRYVASSTYLENAPVSRATAAQTLTGGTLSLTEVTDGAFAHKLVAPADGLGDTRNTSFATRVAHELTNNNHQVDLYVMVPGQGVAKYMFNGDTPTGVDDALADGTLGAYVADGRIIIEGEPRDAVLFNASGVLISRDAAGIESTRLAPGVYILWLRDAAGKTAAVKLAVR